jgi:hypothetical protein
MAAFFVGRDNWIGQDLMKPWKVVRTFNDINKALLKIILFV